MPLDEFIGIVQEHYKTVPDEYKESVVVKIEKEYSWDETDLLFQASYERLETDDEFELRVRQESEHKKRVEERQRREELETLAALQAKYGEK